MTIQVKAISAFWAAAVMSSAVVACMPPAEPQAPLGEGAPGAQAGAGAAATPPKKESAALPAPTDEQCRARASTPAPANATGAGDTKQQFDQLFNAHHETFRCCFDAVEAPRKPLVGGKVTMLVKVDGTGKLKSSEIVSGESDAVSPQTNKCMIDIAGMLAYPKPATSMSFGYKRTFDFKPRR
jgi:hypothetical protein